MKKINFFWLPKFLKRHIVTGSVPGNRIDIDTLNVGDKCYICYQHKNLKKLEFYVEEGTIESWEPQRQFYTVGFDSAFKKNGKPFRHLAGAYSNEIGDTPERAVHNMFSIYLRFSAF